MDNAGSVRFIDAPGDRGTELKVTIDYIPAASLCIRHCRLGKDSTMKAVTWYGKLHVKVQDVPDASILNPRDAVVRITSTAICGSDLHLYDGYIPGMSRGDVLGHEPMGEVVEIGSSVKNLRPGDRVVVPSPSAAAIASSASASSGAAETTPIPMPISPRKYSVSRPRGCTAIRPSPASTAGPPTISPSAP